MFEGYRDDFFAAEIPEYRLGRYAQVVVLRETQSYAVFTTEGQTLDQETVQAGRIGDGVISRVVLFKRKQVAPERRRGKELLRSFGLAPSRDVMTIGRPPKVKVGRGKCEMMGNACGRCVDCNLYGFAATGGTASQRSRVLTDSAFTIRPVDQIARDIKLNAVQETTAGGIAGSAYAERQHLLPQIFLPCVETFLDVTAGEFAYGLANILRTTRYGAETSREGVVRNHVLAIAFSDVELFSNLELTQEVYDQVAGNGRAPEHLSLNQVMNALAGSPRKGQERTDVGTTAGGTEPESAGLLQRIATRAAGRVRLLDGQETGRLVDEVRQLYKDEVRLKEFLAQLEAAATRYAEQTKGLRGAPDASDEDNSDGNDGAV